MNRILVLVEDSLLALRIGRLFNERQISHEIRNAPVRVDELEQYSLLVVHGSYRIANLSGFLENVVMKNLIPVIFLSLNPHAGNVASLNRHANFTFIDEMKMDAEMPLAINIHLKQLTEKEKLVKENRKLKQKIEQEKVFLACKQKLMASGMTEPEAHRHILRLAMNQKLTKYQAAAKILDENRGNSCLE